VPPLVSLPKYRAQSHPAELACSLTAHKFQAPLNCAGLAHMTFHQLRHGRASLLLSMGVSLRAVMEQLGHSNHTKGGQRLRAYPQNPCSGDAADRMRSAFALARAKGEASGGNVHIGRSKCALLVTHPKLRGGDDSSPLRLPFATLGRP